MASLKSYKEKRRKKKNFWKTRKKPKLKIDFFENSQKRENNIPKKTIPKKTKKKKLVFLNMWK